MIIETSTAMIPVLDPDKIYAFPNGKEQKQYIADKIAQTFEDMLHAVRVTGKVTNQRYNQPRFYNYRGDQIDFDLELEPWQMDKVTAYMRNNEREFFDFIQEEHRSYDGYCSLVPQTKEEWCHKKKWGNDRNIMVSVMIEFMLKRSLIDIEEFSDNLHIELINELGEEGGYDDEWN